jgi:hypothetical protein
VMEDITGLLSVWDEHPASRQAPKAATIIVAKLRPGPALRG